MTEVVEVTSDDKFFQSAVARAKTLVTVDPYFVVSIGVKRYRIVR